MKVLVTGCGGRLGKALADRLGQSHQVITLTRESADLADPAALRSIAALDFDVLLHPAAMASLEACEADPDLAGRVNRDASIELARACEQSGRSMLFFSTDYVLDGTLPGLKDESAAVNPLSVYARSKAEAEKGVLDRGAAVIRVSWLFGPEKAAFPEAVLSQALAGKALAAVADKFSLPGFTSDLAEWVEGLLEREIPNRIFHAANPGEPATWHDIAIEVVKALHRSGRLAETSPVEKQSLASLPGFVAGRPRHTAMATSALADWLGKPLRPWREALRAHLRDFHGLQH